MEGSRRTILRLLRWSLVVAVAGGLWFVGYYFGRDAGEVQGHDDGFAAARSVGLEVGRVEGLRIAATDLRSKQVFKETYEVGALLDERLATKRRTTPATDQEIRDEGQALVREILDDVFPEMNGAIDGQDFSIRYMPGNRTLIVGTSGMRHAGLRFYLRSKEEWLAWKPIEKAAVESASDADIAGRPRTAR